MKRFLVTPSIAAMIAVSLVPSCNHQGTETDNPTHPEGIELRRSALAYQAEVVVPPADRDALQGSQREFAFDLYREVAEREAASSNLFLGTHSIATVLAMTYAGARGSTETELASTLRLTLPQAAVHPAMNGLAQALRASVAGTSVKYQALSSVWLARDHATEPAFLDVLSQHYDTGVYLVDFAGDAEGARTSINSWVADASQGLIGELFGPDAIDATTELALTNAAYLSAPWHDRFDPEVTKPREFSLPDGTVVEVPMMSRQWEYPFAFDVDWRALELPFRDARLGMVFVLPNPGEWATFEASFDATRAQAIVAKLEAWKSDDLVDVRVPRFDFASGVDLRPSLEALGMVSAFELARADFRGIDPSGELYVNSFVHRTTVGVDEDGTTGAAASGEILVPLPITPQIWLDRPFLFFVYDHATGTVLFVGRFVRPAGTPRPPSTPPVVRTDAEIICAALVDCPARGTTEAECRAALAADDAAVLEQCADCVSAGVEGCAGYAPCEFGAFGSVCDPAVCAAYCPAHPF